MANRGFFLPNVFIREMARSSTMSVSSSCNDKAEENSLSTHTEWEILLSASKLQTRKNKINFCITHSGPFTDNLLKKTKEKTATVK